MSAQPPSEETILEQALTFTSKEARRAYLRGACGGNEQLRASLESNTVCAGIIGAVGTKT